MTTAKPPSPVVLIVDDEEPIRRVARRILEGGGYRVVDASNGAEALALIDRETRVDLVIADLAMPEIGGDEMARRIRADRPDVKVLYVTGHIDKLFKERPQLWEGEAYLDKPFTSNGLLEAVSLLLYGTLKKAPL